MRGKFLGANVLKGLLSLNSIYSMVYHLNESTTILLYYAIENTMVNKINATYVYCMMGRLDVLPSQIIIHGFPVF